MRPCFNPERHRQRTRAFTLLELLVSTAVSTLILAVLLQCFSQVLNAWTQETKTTGSLREGRTGLQIIAQDLETIVVIPPALPPTFTAADEAKRQRFILTLTTDDYGSARLAFLHSNKVKRNPGTTQPDSGGDVRIVAYTMNLSTDADGSVSQKLWRKEYPSDESWKRINSHFGAGLPLISDAEWTTFSDPAFGAEPVAYDAVRFEVQPLTASTTGGTTTWTPAKSWDAKNVPLYLDLTLRVTNRVTATRLKTADDWRGQGAASTLLLGQHLTPTDYTDDPEVRTFTARLTLNQPDKPLPALP